VNIDRSEGYDGIAEQFMAARRNIGASFVLSWARNNLPQAGSVIDVGCGSGVPITQVLVEEGFEVFGVDASPTLLAAFRRRFPHVRTACEAAQDSAFFNRTFDAAVSIGLLFLLSEDDQERVIYRVGGSLRAGGRFLFSAPRERCEWQDILTGRPSRSLGEKEYERILQASGLCLVRCHQGENHHFDAAKPLL